MQTTIDSPLRSLSVARNEFASKTSLYVEKCVSMIGNINREHRLEESSARVGRCLVSVFSKTRPWLSFPAGGTNILWTTFTGRNRTSGAAGDRQGWGGRRRRESLPGGVAGEGRALAATSHSLRCLCLAAAASLQLSFQLHCIQKILVQITAYPRVRYFRNLHRKWRVRSALEGTSTRCPPALVGVSTTTFKLRPPRRLSSKLMER